MSVLLLTFNPGPSFEAILQSILSQNLAPFEVLAIDSGSTDGTVALMRQAGVDVEVIPQAEFGHGRTRNRIATKARGDLLAFLTHDALPAGSSWLRELAAPFRDPEVAGAYGRQVAPPDASLVEIHLLEYIYPSQDRVVRLAAGQRFQMPEHFFSNANSMVRREVWQGHPFPDGVIMCEDQWWARNVLKAGYEIAYRASAVVTHSHHLSATRTFKRSFDTGVAMKGCDETPFFKVLGGFLAYLASLVGAARRAGAWSQLAPALSRALARAMGYAAGSRYRMLPPGLRRKLSMHPYYWP
ncbi:MAG: glycosyltransferase family 2 protein [Candidatus Dormibacterales bacterium]